MSRQTHKYIMSPGVLTRYQSSHGGRLLLCGKCEKPLEAGNKVVSKPTRGKVRVFHEDCAEELNIW